MPDIQVGAADLEPPRPVENSASEDGAASAPTRSLQVPSQKRSQGVLRIQPSKLRVGGEVTLAACATSSRRSVTMSDVVQVVGSEGTPSQRPPSRAEPTPLAQCKKSHSRRSSSRRLGLGSKSRVAPESESQVPTRFEDDWQPLDASRGKIIGTGACLDDLDAISATSGSVERHSSPSQRRGGGAAAEGYQYSFADSDSDHGGLAGKKKTSIASSSQSRSSAAVFHKAIEHDAKVTEPSLVFLRRALYVVWLTVIAASIMILLVDSGIVTGATDDEQAVRSEGDRASLHTVSFRL